MIVDRGPSIGEYRGLKIPSYINDGTGQWVYDRIAVETDDGVALSQLAANECVIYPGLIYRKKD